MLRRSLFAFILLLSPQWSFASDENVSEGERGVVAQAQKFEAPMARAAFPNLVAGVERFELSNGLKVIFYRRRFAPVFAGQLWVKVGGVDEEIGKSGSAHLLEHMAFKGSETIGTKDYAKEKELLAELDLLAEAGELEGKRAKAVREELATLWDDNEFSRLYSERGAVGMNAATGKDYTFYQIELPTNTFEFWCWMESERILNPVFRQFYKERLVVEEERRSRIDDNPGGLLYEAMIATSYWAHPYRTPTAGWAADIPTITPSDVRKLFDTYYRPDNMVMSLVGDLELSKVKPLLEKYFGRIPKGEEPIRFVDSKEPKQKGKRTTRVTFDARPAVAVAYHKPVYPVKDDIHFTLLHSLLSDGRSSVMYRELVLEKELAMSVFTSEAPGERYPSLFYAGGSPREGVSTEKLLAEIEAILERYKTEKFSEEDLEAAKKRSKEGFLNAMTSNSGLAYTLAHAELLWGNWEALLEMYEIILSTTQEDLQRILKTYIREENKTVAFRDKEKKA